ncbi:aminotransferase class IV [bacterium]|nr:aminotransferase class IV [bacterium]
MLAMTGSYCVLDGIAIPVENVAKQLLFKSKSIYEVIRLINAVPLFFEEHIQRMQRSCEILGTLFPFSTFLIQDQIQLLIHRSRQKQGNIKLVYGQLKKGETTSLLLTFIPHFYPSDDMYRNGVRTTLFRTERVIPNVKLSKEKPKALNRLIDVEGGYFEVLMVNSRGVITEGSRSNLFFIKGDTLHTSPESDVLPGITRNKVIKILKNNHFKLKQTRIHKNSLTDFDALFLTGTSPGVLPVNSVDEARFDVDHPILRTVMTQYQEIVERYLKNA